MRIINISYIGTMEHRTCHLYNFQWLLLLVTSVQMGILTILAFNIVIWQCCELQGVYIYIFKTFMLLSFLRSYVVFLKASFGCIGAWWSFECTCWWSNPMGEFIYLAFPDTWAIFSLSLIPLRLLCNRETLTFLLIYNYSLCTIWKNFWRSLWQFT